MPSFFAWNGTHDERGLQPLPNMIQCLMKIDVSTKKHPNIFAEIDDADAEMVCRYRWAATKRRKKLYVRGHVDGRDVLLHRFIMGEPAGMLVDHRDGDTLHNRRSNLRECTVHQNNQYAVENGVFDHLRVDLQVHTVKRKLADGSVRIHRYNRRTKERLENEDA